MTRDRRRVVGSLVAAAVVLVACGLIALVAAVGNPVSWVGDQVSSGECVNDPGRITDLCANNRPAWWGDAVKVFRDHPLGGSGALTYEIARKRVRDDGTPVLSRTACRCSCSPTSASSAWRSGRVRRRGGRWHPPRPTTPGRVGAGGGRCARLPARDLRGARAGGLRPRLPRSYRSDAGRRRDVAGGRPPASTIRRAASHCFRRSRPSDRGARGARHAVAGPTLRRPLDASARRRALDRSGKRGPSRPVAGSALTRCRERSAAPPTMQAIVPGRVPSINSPRRCSPRTPRPGSRSGSTSSPLAVTCAPPTRPSIPPTHSTRTVGNGCPAGPRQHARGSRRRSVRAVATRRG